MERAASPVPANNETFAAQKAEPKGTRHAAPPDTAAPTATPVYSNIARLQQENRDTVGWLHVPGTDIQYPVVQGADNEYYMTHNQKEAERQRRDLSGLRQYIGLHRLQHRDLRP